MAVLLLTGPPASGKNTIGEQLAREMQRCAVVESDVLREMVMQPRRRSWEGEEGHLQQRLGIDNACAVTRNFESNGYDVIITDTLSDASLGRYRELLPESDIWSILVLPGREEIARRLLSRVDYLSRGEVEIAYEQQARFDGYDEKLDNTNLSISDAVAWVKDHWPHTES